MRQAINNFIGVSFYAVELRRGERSGDVLLLGWVVNAGGERSEERSPFRLGDNGATISKNCVNGAGDLRICGEVGLSKSF